MAKARNEKLDLKVAFCLCGIVGGTQGKDGEGVDVDPELCWKSYNENIFSKNDVDVFIHTWSVKWKDKIDSLYRPKLAIYEPQKKFDSLNERLLSRWYSHNKTLELRRNFERETGIKYDLVFVGRFDLVWFKPLDFSIFKRNKFYTAYTNSYPHIKDGYEVLKYKTDHIDNRIYDLWFVSNPDLMDKTDGIYSMVERYKGKANIHKVILEFLMRENIPYLHMFYRGFDFELYRWTQGNYK